MSSEEHLLMCYILVLCVDNGESWSSAASTSQSMHKPPRYLAWILDDKKIRSDGLNSVAVRAHIH